LRRAVELDPNSSWAYAEMGGALRMLGRYAEALEALDKALKLSPDDAWALGVKGMLLCEIAEYSKAIEVLDRAVKLNPKDAESLYFKGWALEYLGAKNAEAKEAYETAVKMEPDNLWYHVGFADVMNLFDTEAAKEEYGWVIVEAKKRGCSDSGTLSLIGWCHYRLGLYDEAVRALSDSVSLDPEAAHTQFDLALALMCNERYVLSLREYQKGLKMVKVADPQRQRGLLSVAFEDLSQALKKQPSLWESKEAQEAKALLKDALKKL